MAVTSCFTNANQLYREVEGCPLAAPGKTQDTSACAHCSFNLAFPKVAAIGCTVRTPPTLYDSAVAALSKRNPSLHSELLVLLKSAQQVEPSSEAAERWQKLATSWFGETAEDDAAEREVAMVVARFARAAIELGEPVEILS